jgi:hypothetical protein
MPSLDLRGSSRALACVFVTALLAACSPPFEAGDLPDASIDAPVVGDDAAAPREAGGGPGHKKDSGIDPSPDAAPNDASEVDAPLDATDDAVTDAPSDAKHGKHDASQDDAGSEDAGTDATTCPPGAPSCTPQGTIVVCGPDQQPQSVPGTCSASCVVSGRFTVKGNVVLDSSTGLAWTLAAGSKMNATVAPTACVKLGGRLPSDTELEGLVLNQGTCHPCIDQAAFPQTPSDDFWMQKVGTVLTAKNFETGAAEVPAGGVAYVRCVVPAP